ncbi:MAG: hypothetical protein ABWK53_10710 [Anaerolineales bacterium]
MSPIIFNGKSYSSVDEMPPEVRRAYEQVVNLFADKNRDGLPDILEGAIREGEAHVQSVSINSDGKQVIVDGKAYSSIEEMPAEVRQKYERAIGEIGQMLKGTNQDHVPDIFAGAPPDQSIPPGLQSMPKPATGAIRSIVTESTSPVVTDVTPKVWPLLLIGGVIAVLVVVIGGLIVLSFFR